jgi:nuclear polyadenylated RNA-binding protein 3
MKQDTAKFPATSTTHLSLPSYPNIPGPRSQIDPVLNMTSTHIDPFARSTSPIPTAQIGTGIVEHIGPITTDIADTIDDASFSDPYDEQEKAAEEGTAKKDMENTDVDDDYAMTLDSEVEEKSSRQDVSNASFEQEMQSQSAPVSVAATENHASTAPESFPNSVAPDGADNPTSHNPFSPATATAEDFPVAIESSTASAANEAVQSHSQPTYEDVSSNGGIDIQQLLDNITATAALNAPNTANTTPTSAISSSPNFLPPGSMGLPAHASLPPRPQITQKPPMHPAYTPQDDIRKYHAGPPGFPPPQLSSYRPPGVPASIVAAGAPGTSTDPRNTLPPPPSASFQPAPSITTPPSLTHISYPQNHRLPIQDRPANSIEPADADDDPEISWSPAVQKLYDEFLASERMYVSEGLWDRFPAGSRLFIG